MSEYITPRYRIGIDEEACGNALECLKCVRICLDHGANCLGYLNKEVPDLEKFVPHRLEDIEHKILASFMINCDGCRQCIDICPKNALSLIEPEPQIPRAIIHRDGSIVLCGTLADGTEIIPE